MNITEKKVGRKAKGMPKENHIYIFDFYNLYYLKATVINEYAML